MIRAVRATVRAWYHNPERNWRNTLEWLAAFGVLALFIRTVILGGDLSMTLTLGIVAAILVIDVLAKAIFGRR